MWLAIQAVKLRIRTISVRQLAYLLILRERIEPEQQRATSHPNQQMGKHWTDVQRLRQSTNETPKYQPLSW
jgi:hypothetical protein